MAILGRSHVWAGKAREGSLFLVCFWVKSN